MILLVRKGCDDLYFAEYVFDEDKGFVPTGYERDMPCKYRTADGKKLYQGMPVYGSLNREFEVKGFSTDMECCVYKDAYGAIHGFPAKECWYRIKAKPWKTLEGGLSEILWQESLSGYICFYFLFFGMAFIVGKLFYLAFYYMGLLR